MDIGDLTNVLSVAGTDFTNAWKAVNTPTTISVTGPGGQVTTIPVGSVTPSGIQTAVGTIPTSSLIPGVAQTQQTNLLLLAGAILVLVLVLRK